MNDRFDAAIKVSQSHDIDGWRNKALRRRDPSLRKPTFVTRNREFWLLSDMNRFRTNELSAVSG